MVVGTPNRLTHPDKIVAYFRELARTSKRVRVFSVGRSHGGREMIVAAIAEPSVLARLDDIKKRNKELADPRVTDEKRAKAIAASTPPIYYITAGLHSPETGPPEMVMELAYRLAVSEQDNIREIRKNVVTLITPVLEMDGRARMVDWYYRFLTKVTDLDDSPPRMAPYWGDYTAHDNNRDGLQMSQPLTRNYVRHAYHEYLPVVSLDLHESVPLLYVSMGTGPYNETIDPITITEWQWISSYEVSECDQARPPRRMDLGLLHGLVPGLSAVGDQQPQRGRAVLRDVRQRASRAPSSAELKNSKFAKRRTNSRQWYRAWPPEKTLKWSLRNNTNYMQTGVLASLQLAARNGETLLFNFWKKNANSLARGKTKKPYAFAIRAAQPKRAALAHLLWLLRGHRIEVHRARTAAKYGDVKVAAGDYLVRLDQPYRNFAVTLLTKQTFPKTADHTPYDDVAWSLDMMLGVEVVAIDDDSVLADSFDLVTDAPALAGTVEGGSRWLVEHRGQGEIASLRWKLPGAKVRALTTAWEGHRAGSLVVEGVSADELRGAIEPLHLDAVAIAALPDVATVEVNTPRVAVFHTWRNTQDSGWVRYTLEELGIPFTLINKDQLRAGKLGDSFDVIIVPSQGGMGFKSIVHGVDPKWSPMPYTKTAEFPSHGVVDSSPDITGGMGFSGLANLGAFVEGGGVLIGLASGGVLASDSGIARPLSSSRVTGTPGSHVATKLLRPEHPLAWGYDEHTYVFRGNGPVFNLREFDRGMAVMQFGDKTWIEAEREADKKAGIPVDEPKKPKKPKKDAKKKKKRPLALSGFVKDASSLSRKPALVDVPVGKGRVIAYSWNPMHRYQNHHDFGFVTNALLFFDDMPAEPPSKQEMKRREVPAPEGVTR